MALKTLMLRKRLTDAKKELEAVRANDEEFVTREAELETSISEVNTEEERDAVSEAIDSFEAEKTEHEEKKADLERQVADLEAELQEEEKEQDVPQAPAEERKEISKMEVRESKEYLHAYAEMIRNGMKTGNYDEREVRSLLTESVGYVPVPTYVENKIKTAWERNGIMDLVKKTYVKGNLKIGFEISATGATAHTEGESAPNEEEIVLGAMTLIPQNYKKWIRVSDEALEVGLGGDEAILDYLYDEMSYQIAKAVSDALIGAIKNLPTTSLGVDPSAQQITSAPALDTIGLAVAQLSDEADDVTVVMNKSTYGDFITAMAGGNYAFDPFKFANRVLFSSALPAYSTASAGAVYMIVGDFNHGAQANFPNGADIKFVVDPYTNAEADLVKVVGRQYVGAAPVACNAFTNVKKPS